MLCCKECGKRFVIDCDQLAFYSHKDQFKCNERNFFNVHHKLLVSQGRMKLKWIKSIFHTIVKELRLME